MPIEVEELVNKIFKELEKQEEVKQMDGLTIFGIVIITLAAAVGIPIMKKLEPDNSWYWIYAVLIWFFTVTSLILRALS